MDDRLTTAIIGAGGLGRALAVVLQEYTKRDIPVFEGCDFVFYDGDEVEPENVWTQGFSKDSADLILHKADALYEEFNSPFFLTVPEFVKDSTPLDKFKISAVVCAVDNLEARRMAYSYAKERELYFLDGRVNGKTIMVYDSTCPGVNFDELLAPEDSEADSPQSCLFQWEKEKRIVHTTPMITASIMVQFFMNWRRGEANNLLERAF